MTNCVAPFTCDIAAIGLAGRQKHVDRTASLFRLVLKVHDLADGYSFDMLQVDIYLSLAITFITREGLCCPFLDFALRVVDAGRHLRLDITGSPGVKPFSVGPIPVYELDRLLGGRSAILRLTPSDVRLTDGDSELTDQRGDMVIGPCVGSSVDFPSRPRARS